MTQQRYNIIINKKNKTIKKLFYKNLSKKTMTLKVS